LVKPGVHDTYGSLGPFTEPWSPMTTPIRILGIDPGLRRTGWGLITAQGTKLTYGDCGVVTSDGDLPLALRLRELFEGISRIVETVRPDEVAVEETFVNKDAQATLKLGHARAMALVVPALAGLPVFEYAANLIKKTVAGSGHAEKVQIQAMVRFLLPKAEFRVADAADALAIAITHASHRDAHALRQAHLPKGKRRTLTGQAAAGQGLEGKGFSAAAAARIEAALAKQG
jgi:crossover junction endodeoxyribonuclease RuvC